MGDVGGDGVQTRTHMSADDLNDGFILDKEDKKTLSYQVGGSTACKVSVLKWREYVENS